jgi:hypothetical protein
MAGIFSVLMAMAPGLAVAVVVGMGVIMGVPVVMAGMVVIVMIATMVVAALAMVRAALPGVCRDRLHQALQVRLELGEPRRFLARALVHVQPAVHLDLKAVAARLRV